MLVLAGAVSAGFAFPAFFLFFAMANRGEY
jgi:hypothetical protein